jgi:hypothetical protein
MKYITLFVKMFKEIPKPLGRWRLEYCNTKLNNKIDLSNEDHCGPCGKYALEKRNENISKNSLYKKY